MDNRYVLLLAAALAVSFVTALIFGKFFIPFMRKKKLGQMIREVGPNWHMSKQGTPIMGGLLFIVGIFFASVTAGAALMWGGEWQHIIVFVFALGFGLIGFLDDYEKVAKKQNLGLTVIQKLVLQLALSVVFVSLLRYMGIISTDVYIPFVNISFEIPWVVYMVLAVLAITAVVNAVNFTDGVDGLLGTVTLPVMAFFLAFAICTENGGAALFAAAAAGGIIAFLVYNFNPAKIFMGDTGSLFLGGAVCGLAFATDVPLVLPVVGIIYVIEILSVVLQVVYFKLTHGKRLFRMSPVHHHFELSGWSEKKICYVFGGITVIACVLAWLGVGGLIR